MNFFGTPAYRLADFGRYKQDLIVGASFSLSAPTGQYDGSRLVNIGTNRWAAKVEIGLSKVVMRWILELAAAGTFFVDNNEFFGGVTRAQNPIEALQTHAIRSFSGGAWLAVGSTYYRGGNTMTGGAANANRQDNSRLGITLSLPVNGRHSIELYASSGISTRSGTDDDVVGVAWQVSWGGGLGR